MHARPFYKSFEHEDQLNENKTETIKSLKDNNNLLTYSTIISNPQNLRNGRTGLQTLKRKAYKQTKNSYLFPCRVHFYINLVFLYTKTNLTQRKQ